VSCCDSGEDILWIGGTYRLDIELRDPETDALVSMLPKARGAIVTADGVSLATFSSDTGEIEIDADAGTATLTLSSTATDAISIDGDRADAWLQIEFFDDGVSPEEVEPYPPEQLVTRRTLG
jgi:hypothetical protein